MKPGDLVKPSAPFAHDVGIIVKIHRPPGAWLEEAQVLWLKNLGDGLSWMHLKDLELVSDASR